MDNFKNTVIVVLSSVILVQSIFLVYFIFRGRRAPVSIHVQKKAADDPLLKRERFSEPAKPVAVEKKVTIKDRPVKSAGKIALVLDDWGYNLKNRDFITGNDYHISVSVLPFKAYSATIARLAHDKNKDVIIHMPMEPESKGSYGLEENTLLTSMSRSDIDKILTRAFDDIPYAKGLSNHMGSEATQNRRLMVIVMEFLKANNLFFLDSFVTSKSVCGGCAKKTVVPIARRDVFIDNENDSAYIRKQVKELAHKAEVSGLAVGIGHDRPATISVLQEVIPELLEQGFEFVNISEIIDSSRSR